MQAGDVFKLSSQSADIHYWVVVTDTAAHPESVVCVNWTSETRFTDPACILNVGDHPQILRPSSIECSRAKKAALHEWESLNQAKLLRQFGSVNNQVIQKIRDGAAITDRLALEIEEILKSQSIIPTDPEGLGDDPL